MKGFEWRVFFDDVRQFFHERFHAGGVAFEVSGLHLVPEELLVAGAGAQALANGPASAVGGSGLEAQNSQLVSSACDLVLDARDETFHMRPLVAAAGDVEGPSAHELQGGAQRGHGFGGSLTLRPADALCEPLVVGPHRVAESVDPLA